MIKEWSEAVLQRAHEAVDRIRRDIVIPEYWNKKWLCPKPKVDHVIAILNELRPLNLLEAPRKLLMGIIVKWITTIWELRGIPSESLYGFRPSRSCEGPTLQVLNAQEVTEKSGIEFHGSSWDIKKAIDTVPKQCW